MLDILIRNGLVVDGSGSPGRQADVAVEGDRIVDTGSLPEAAAHLVLDASGQVVAPGFVDMHSHADQTLPLRPTADSLVHQGITTVVAGNCGGSPAPVSEATKPALVALAKAFGLDPEFVERGATFGGYLDWLSELRPSLNVAHLVGQGTVRAGVMGPFARPATAEEVSRMQEKVAEAMDSGAFGVSTGLVYPPSSYAGMAEIVAVTRPVGQRGGFYFSHIRGEGDTLLEAVAEAIQIGRETGATVHIAHFKAAYPANWHLAPRALALIDEARAAGLDVTADMYPYTAGSSPFRFMLPEWAHEGGKEVTLHHLGDPEDRRRMVASMRSEGFFSGAAWDKVVICRARDHVEWEGRTVADLAAAAEKSPFDWTFDSLLETDLDMHMILFVSADENLPLQLRHPAMTIGTDASVAATEGPLSVGKPHPRTYGTYSQVLARFVREEKVLSLAEAIRKMAGYPAEILRLPDRGLLKKGYKADLVVFDLAKVADLATYQDPHRYPAGIHHVLVNGQFVIRDGEHTQARPGEVLRRPPALNHHAKGGSI